jgi:hypothetical protein
MAPLAVVIAASEDTHCPLHLDFSNTHCIVVHHGKKQRRRRFQVARGVQQLDPSHDYATWRMLYWWTLTRQQLTRPLALAE